MGWGLGTCEASRETRRQLDTGLDYRGDLLTCPWMRNSLAGWIFRSFDSGLLSLLPTVLRVGTRRLVPVPAVAAGRARWAGPVVSAPPPAAHRAGLGAFPRRRERGLGPQRRSLVLREQSTVSKLVFRTESQQRGNSEIRERA